MSHQVDTDNYLMPKDKTGLLEIIQILWKQRVLVIILTSIFAMSSVVFALILKDYYQSESLLVATKSPDAGGVSQFAGLASLAGIGVDGSGDPVTEIIELIRSREFVKHLISFDGVLEGIMAAKKFDSKNKKLLYTDNFNQESNTWLLKPTYLQAHKKYRDKLLDISQSKRTGVVSIKIEHLSPIFAKELLQLIINEANSLTRKRDLESTNLALAFLKDELSKTALIEIRQSINTLIESQLERQMTARINEDYILIAIEPPFIPDRKSRPHRARICIIITLIGAVMSLMIVLIRDFFIKR